jgi:hypothetical protein
VLAAAVLEQKAELLAQELLILAAVAAARVTMLEHQVAAALAWSSFPFQHHDTQAQPQAHQQSPQAAQIQF